MTLIPVTAINAKTTCNKIIILIICLVTVSTAVRKNVIILSNILERTVVGDNNYRLTRGMCDALWTASVRDWQKPLPHSSQRNGFSFEWTYLGT